MAALSALDACLEALRGDPGTLDSVRFLMASEALNKSVDGVLSREQQEASFRCGRRRVAAATRLERPGQLHLCAQVLG
jgi:hypothetical protein